MLQFCYRCSRLIEGQPGHYVQGFKNGKPFRFAICMDCRAELTDDQIEELEKGQKSATFAEELGILGQ
jgi:hypothetical protein